MKIVHITTLTFGGAGMACMNLHNELLKLGVDSWVLTQKGRGALPPRVVVYPPTPWWRKVLSALGIGRLLRDSHRTEWHALQKRVGQHFFYSFPTSDDDLSLHPLVQEADIVHLHFVARFLDYPSFFTQVRKPIVWTFHDQNPLWAGLHSFVDFDIQSVAAACEEQIMEVKQAAYAQIDRMTIVCLSSEMERMVEEHSGLRRFDRVRIPNGIDEQVFDVVADRAELRRLHGIPEDKKVILFVSQILQDHNKGYRRLVQAYEQLADDSCVLLLVGRLRKGQSIDTSLPYVHRTATSDKSLLAQYYALADLFVLASRSETFAQTPLEALACGVPVVTTPVQGVSDAVRASCGTIAEDFSPTALCEAMRRELSQRRDPQLIRQEAVPTYSLSTIAQQVKGVYDRMMPQADDKERVSSETNK